MLHIVNHSPIERSLWERVAPDDAVLLIENGVYGVKLGSLAANDVIRATENIRLFVLKADLEARGIQPDEVIAGVEVVDDSGFVDLTVEHSVIQSW